MTYCVWRCVRTNISPVIKRRIGKEFRRLAGAHVYMNLPPTDILERGAHNHYNHEIKYLIQVVNHLLA